VTASSTPAPASAPGAQAHRVIFIDFARAIAVVLMVIGHAVSALLAPQYNSGPWYDRWQFQRGLTSSLFLLLSGFAFSVATSQHWASHTRWSPFVAKRLRRFIFFMLIGYSLHFPVLPIAALRAATDAQWRTFLLVDVLQLIGATFVIVQLLVLVCRTRTVFMWVSLALAAVLVAFTPAVWSIDWTQHLPISLAAYLSQGTGSIFPLFPFAASVLVGAGMGQLYARWGAANLTTFANTALLGTGVVLTLIVFAGRAMGLTVYPPGPSAVIPPEFVLRTGVSLILLGAIAYASHRIQHLPRMLAAAAQESLLVYYVHLCVLYGSIWSPGLLQAIGPTLRPLQTLPIAVVLVVSMVVLAWQWNWCKHARPTAARWIRVGVAVLVLYRLL